MYPAVKQVTANRHYQLTIDFENGEQGSLDMTPYLEFGIFKRLKDPAAFKQVHIAFDTIEWESGVDLDPEFVYAICTGLFNKEKK